MFYQSFPKLPGDARPMFPPVKFPKQRGTMGIVSLSPLLEGSLLGGHCPRQTGGLGFSLQPVGGECYIAKPTVTRELKEPLETQEPLGPPLLARGCSAGSICSCCEGAAIKLKKKKNTGSSMSLTMGAPRSSGGTRQLCVYSLTGDDGRVADGGLGRL